MKYAQLVVGPAGSGKEHFRATNRSVQLINLDPAAEHFKYEVDVDIRDIISVQDVQEDEEMLLGPNGALVFCMEYMIKEIDSLRSLMQDGDDDYYIIDCPGQIELYSHLPVMPTFVKHLKDWGFNIVTVFLLDSQFMLDADKFISGALTTLSTMIALETPAVSLITKMDLVEKEDKDWIEGVLEGTAQSMLDEHEPTPWSAKHRQLSELIASVLDEYSLVRFYTLNSEDEDNVAETLQIIDNCIQYGEDADVRDRLPDEDDDMEEVSEDQGYADI